MQHNLEKLLKIKEMLKILNIGELKLISDYAYVLRSKLENDQLEQFRKD